MTQFLKSLIKVSEKAANIARICRQDKHLFTLLVQEKGDDEKNPRVVHDFKTLADVLIQETIKHDIGKQFPTLASHIKGEENNSFSNTLGDTICVVVKEDEASTAHLLSKVLNGDTTAAQLLAAEVHRTVSLECDSPSLENIPEDMELPISHLGMWIDPIDSTFEYIEGEQVTPTTRGIHHKGLQCVTVLIGVYDRRSGDPILGVINQPFHSQQNSEWHGRYFWGLCFDSIYETSVPLSVQSSTEKVVVLSSNESPILKQKLSEQGFKVVDASGAGYKCLAVALGQADIYLLSRPTTYIWDICAPHAVLRAQMGGVIEYVPATQGKYQVINYFRSENTETCEKNTQILCNNHGMIAYRDSKYLNEIIQIIKEC